MAGTVSLRAPSDKIGTTVQSNGWSCVVPPSGVVVVPQSIVSALIDIGFWPEGSTSSSPPGDGGDAALYDPGDLTVLFDNQLI